MTKLSAEEGYRIGVRDASVNSPPNTALHRTPSASPPSPVSFQPFGVRREKGH